MCHLINDIWQNPGETASIILNCGKSRVQSRLTITREELTSEILGKTDINKYSFPLWFHFSVWRLPRDLYPYF